MDRIRGRPADTSVISKLEAAIQKSTEAILENAKSLKRAEEARRTYDAGMKSSVDKEAKVGITNGLFKVSDSAGIRAVIPPMSEARITSSDNHIRHLIREELQQFVNRESQRGGLFSRW
ncbi:hypothetical protein [Xenorhabdus doucetiae]|uniref:hypothetical protein n=1 Tax=Xenorhabdus doucetiae TaxID=351671 RepID=UPI002B409936|nr:MULTISPECIES: hypothetical protein [unclassified Xenorhabdus]